MRHRDLGLHARGEEPEGMSRFFRNETEGSCQSSDSNGDRAADARPDGMP